MSRPSFRFLRFLRSRKFWQRSVFALACFITLLAAAYAIENYRGRSAWEEYQREAAARGVKLRIEQLIKPPIPDEENFAAIPLFQELQSPDPQVRERASKSVEIPFASHEAQGSFGGRSPKEPLNFEDWRKVFLSHKLLDSPTDNAVADVLRVLDRYGPVLNTLRNAAHERSGNRLNAGWEKGMNADFLRMEGLLDLTRILSLRTAALLAVGRSDEALENWMVGFRLCEMLKGEPSLLAGMLRVMMLHLVIAPVWEGVSAHQWTAVQLRELDAALRTINLVEEYPRFLESERVFTVSAIESLMAQRSQHRSEGKFLRPFGHEANPAKVSYPALLVTAMIPDGWFYQNLVRINRWHDRAIAESKELPPAEKPDGNLHLRRIWWKFPYNFLLYAAVVGMGDNRNVALEAQAEIELCRVACAIERHYLRTGTAPARLENLVPSELDQLPRDLFSNEPLQYVPREDGSALLYSIGSDRKDDGGSEEADMTWEWKPSPPHAK